MYTKGQRCMGVAKVGVVCFFFINFLHFPKLPSTKMHYFCFVFLFFSSFWFFLFGTCITFLCKTLQCCLK